MTNKEKYPNTDDALKAFAEHNKHCKCGCTFEEWLDREAAPSGIGKSIAGMIFGSLLLGELVDDLRRAAKDKAKAQSSGEPKSKKPSNNDELTGIECPICHGKNGKIDGMLVPSFTCPDCNSFIGYNESSKVESPRYKDTFQSFIADLCKKNNAKA